MEKTFYKMHNNLIKTIIKEKRKFYKEHLTIKKSKIVKLIKQLEELLQEIETTEETILKELELNQLSQLIRGDKNDC